MRLLVAAATDFELALLQQHLESNFMPAGDRQYCKGNLEIRICITGIGLMHTAFALAEDIHSFNPHFCLQAGIAGAYNRRLALTDLVIVQSEILGDLGVDDNGRFQDIFDIGLMNSSVSPYHRKILMNRFQDFPLKLNLPFVTSLSVNMTSGSAEVIRKREEHYDCDIENMEGAAFHFVCLKKQIPFLQIRSISNYVTPRDKSSWKIPEAIEQLNKWLIANLPQ
jgi:futalosine hydrolase